MPTPVNQQINAIHAMLSAGQRNLRIERHSLLLWGLAGGALLFFSEHILTPEDFPSLEQRALGWLLLLASVFGSVGYADWRLTRHVKQARDETWSFVHRQVQKVWWLLIGIGVLLTFATFFYGGGYMVCAAWLVLIGIGLYVHGLFSEELLEWTGALTIALGIASLATRQSYEHMRWIACAVFALGLPLLALLLDRGRHRSAAHRLGQMLGWLAVVMALPLLAHWQQQHGDFPDGPVISLADYRAGKGAASASQIVELPAGTAIPVDIELSGDLFASPDQQHAQLPLTLSEPIQLLLRDGKLSGDSRFPGGDWQASRQARWISIPWIRAELSQDGGPLIRSRLEVRMRPTGESRP